MKSKLFFDSITCFLLIFVLLELFYVLDLVFQLVLFALIWISTWNFGGLMGVTCLSFGWKLFISPINVKDLNDSILNSRVGKYKFREIKRKVNKTHRGFSSWEEFRSRSINWWIDTTILTYIPSSNKSFETVTVSFKPSKHINLRYVDLIVNNLNLTNHQVISNIEELETIIRKILRSWRLLIRLKLGIIMLFILR